MLLVPLHATRVITKKTTRKAMAAIFFIIIQLILTVKLRLKLWNKKQKINDQTFFSVCSVSSVEE
jgi:hypothetical protein